MRLMELQQYSLCHLRLLGCADPRGPSPLSEAETRGDHWIDVARHALGVHRGEASTRAHLQCIKGHHISLLMRATACLGPEGLLRSLSAACPAENEKAESLK